MSYNQQMVTESFNSSDPNKLDKHRLDVIKAVRTLIILSEKFNIDDIHKVLQEKFGRPETSNYTTIVNVMVKENYLNKDKDGYFTPSNIVRELVGK